MSYNYPSLLKDRIYVSLSGLEQTLSASVTSSASSLTDSRLRTSNSLNEDLILPYDVRNLNETFLFGSAYLRTKEALNKIVNEYPIGLSGGVTGTLYLEQLEQSHNFISTLTNYEWWVMRQLCGASITSSTMTFTAMATAVRESASATITSSSPTFAVPIVIRDASNLLLPPQGVYNKVKLDSYYNDLLGQDPRDAIESVGDLTPYERVLTTAIGFDQGIANVLKNWSGTGDHKFTFATYDGQQQSYVIPDVFTELVNRNNTLTELVPGFLKEGDEEGILDRMLNAMADMFDETKVYIDGLKQLFKNHWGNYDKIPKGYIQQLVAHQYGIELFTSQNRVIKDDFRIRGEYRTQKEITFEFWNRILCSLVYILKTKGTIEAIRATGRAYGFTPGLLQVYELGSYKSIYNSYYSEVRNFSEAEFRPSTTNSKKYFTSISATTSASLTSFMAHVRFQHIDDPLRAASSGASGVLFSLHPTTQGAQLSYQWRFDNSSPSTSGYPYVQFVFSVSGYALSSTYAFVESAMNLNADKQWHLFFGRQGSTLYGRLGFTRSNYVYYEPDFTTITASYTALGSNAQSYSAVELGSLINIPKANISHFLLQRINRNDQHMKNIVLDPTYVGVPNGYATKSILVWKLNEYSTLSTAGQNYILDAGPSGITGSPSFVGTDGNPYNYEFDNGAFFNDGVPGFKQQITSWLNSASAVKDVVTKEKGVRVGISLAAPINNYIHTVFGSGIGQLFAEPRFVFSTTGNNNATHSYDLVEDKITETFTQIGATRNDIQLNEYIKFIARIGAHLGSFFEFIEQVIPASKRLVEKGLIIENPVHKREILRKTGTTIEGPFSDAVTVDDHELEASIEQKIQGNVTISNSASVEIGYTNLTAGITISPSAEIISVQRGSIGAINSSINSTFSGQLESIITRNVSTSASFSGTIGDTYLLIGTASTNSAIVQSVALQRPMIEYIPREMLNALSYTYFGGNGKFGLKNNYLNRIAPQSIGLSAYFVNVMLDKENFVLRTSTTASDEEKRIGARISITDKTGRKIATSYPAIEIDTRQCLIDGLNRIRITVDGEDIPFNEHVKRFRIANKEGLEVEMTVKNSPNDGIASNVDERVLFTNLLNSADRGKAVSLIFANSAEEFSQATGLSVEKRK